MLLTCRTCNTKLESGHSGESYFCRTCDQYFPVVNNVPILVKSPGLFLARTFLYNEELIRQQNAKINQLEKILDSSERSGILLKIQKGLIENLQHVKQLQAIIDPFIKKEDIVTALGSKEDISFYGGTLEYLKRDWCWLPEGEKELEIIFNTISSFVNKHLKEKNNVLILGAGAGRSAWDLCRVFENVYAVDSSLNLVNYYYTLLKSNIRFNQIVERNVYSAKDVVLPFEASLQPQESNKELRRSGAFHFFAGYASKTFLPAESMDTIASIYFTDVLPIRSLLEEVKRILKPGGLFIHFGPLGYHFGDPKICFSAEELKAVIEQNGFTILEEVRIATPHLDTGVSMDKTIFDNWSFVAVKNEEPVKEISSDSKIYLPRKINYDIKGMISEAGLDQMQVNINLLNGEVFEGSVVILEIIKLANGRKISEIVDELTKIYKEDVHVIRDNVLGLINELHKAGIIAIVRPD